MQRKRKPSRGRRDKNASARRTVRTPEEVAAINADDRESLDKFITHHGKILPQRVTGVSAKQQRKVKKIVKQARNKNVV